VLWFNISITKILGYKLYVLQPPKSSSRCITLELKVHTTTINMKVSEDNILKVAANHHNHKFFVHRGEIPIPNLIPFSSFLWDKLAYTHKHMLSGFSCSSWVCTPWPFLVVTPSASHWYYTTIVYKWHTHIHYTRLHTNKNWLASTCKSSTILSVTEMGSSPTEVYVGVKDIILVQFAKLNVCFQIAKVKCSPNVPHRRYIHPTIDWNIGPITKNSLELL